MNRHLTALTVTLLMFATSCSPSSPRVGAHEADIKAIKDDQSQ